MVSYPNATSSLQAAHLLQLCLWSCWNGIHNTLGSISRVDRFPTAEILRDWTMLGSKNFEKQLRNFTRKEPKTTRPPWRATYNYNQTGAMILESIEIPWSYLKILPSNHASFQKDSLGWQAMAVCGMLCGPNNFPRIVSLTSNSHAQSHVHREIQRHK